MRRIQVSMRNQLSWMIMALLVIASVCFMTGFGVYADMIVDGPASEADLLSEEEPAIPSSDDTEVTSRTMTISYDSSLYSVTLNGSAIASGATVTITSESTDSLVVTKLGEDDINVIVGGKLLEAESKTDDSATYKLQLKSDMNVDSIYVTPAAYSATVKVSDDSSKYDVTFPNGKYVASGEDYMLCLQLKAGYTQSDVAIFTDATGYHRSSGLVCTSEGTQSIFDNDTVSDFQLDESQSNKSSGTYVFCCKKIDSSYKVYIGDAIPSRYGSYPITGNTYTARFFYNGTYKDVSTSYNSVVNEIATPDKSGYMFAGWYTSAGEKYDFSAKVTHNLNLFAHWEESCNVTFQGEGIQTVTKTVIKNETVSKPVTPVRLGYTFLGWYTDEEGSNEYDFDTPVISDLTLYGLWNYTPIDISKVTVSKIAAKTYTGKALKPAVTLKYDSYTLTSGTDFMASYSANVKVGTAAVTLTGKGVFTGKRTVHFLINPKSTSIKKVNNKKSKKLTITWKKASGAAGYKIYRSTSKNGKYTKIASVKSSASSYTDKKVTKKKTYYYKVTVIAKSGKYYYESTMSGAKSAKVK